MLQSDGYPLSVRRVGPGQIGAARGHGGYCRYSMIPVNQRSAKTTSVFLNGKEDDNNIVSLPSSTYSFLVACAVFKQPMRCCPYHSFDQRISALQRHMDTDHLISPHGQRRGSSRPESPCRYVVQGEIRVVQGAAPPTSGIHASQRISELSSRLVQNPRQCSHLIALASLSSRKSAGRTTRPSFRLLLAQSYARWPPRLLGCYCRSRCAT